MQEIRTFLFQVEAYRLKESRKKKIISLMNELDAYEIDMKKYRDWGKYYEEEEESSMCWEHLYRMDTQNKLYQKVIDNVLEAPSKVQLSETDIELHYTEEEKKDIVGYMPVSSWSSIAEINDDYFKPPFQECTTCYAKGEIGDFWTIPRIRKFKK